MILKWINVERQIYIKKWVIIMNILCKFEESLKYYKKALKIDQELVHPSFIASSLNNIGVIYEN